MTLGQKYLFSGVAFFCLFLYFVSEAVDRADAAYELEARILALEASIK